MVTAQNEDGGWGSSVADTSLAISALTRYHGKLPRDVFEKGIAYILNSQLADGSFKASYGGIYTQGWNYEEPMATALTAMRALWRYNSLNNDL